MEIKDVENLANLARLDLTETEKREVLSDLGSILGYVKQIESVEVDNQATSPVGTNYNVWREDELQSRDFSSELISKQFPDSKDGFLKVKKIL
jgi:aspartyl-tRNA(Asn)/glutamyl-tRNA(Gln) amidotransferase subunit C